MSSSVFANLRKSHPALSKVLAGIEKWFAAHSTLQVVDPRRVRRSLKGSSPEELGEALSLLVDRGYFDQLYAVELPNGVLLSEPLVPTPLDMPDRLRDRYDNPINTSTAHLVPVLRKVR